MPKTPQQISEEIYRCLKGEKVGDGLFAILMVIQSLLASVETPQIAENLWLEFINQVEGNFPQIQQAIADRTAANGQLNDAPPANN